MHRTLKRQAIQPPCGEPAPRSSANFDAFRREYNEERPHERCSRRRRRRSTSASPRPYPSRLPAPEYPGHFLVKKITTGGTFRFRSRLLVPRQRDGRPTHRTRRDRRRNLGDLFQHRVARDLRRARLHHSWVTKSVTHVPGHFCYLSSRTRAPGLTLDVALDAHARRPANGRSPLRQRRRPSQVARLADVHGCAAAARRHEPQIPSRGPRR